ncbi:hypothetical protein EJ08DRAFT_645142 [Tothia fuscella]|uniref:VOC domain-containing protein n=1 Tax=Tothia fuscella TaxID=1048955 RepID=A0A9P4U4J8_9PEZI|nr:hypothetical protein EJ08DRAFT_645142 [Tothia fuscella]
MATESGEHPPIPPEGSPCWIEIPARDVEKLKTFYSALFPSWKFTPDIDVDSMTGIKTSQYSFTRPKGFGGGIVQMPEDIPLGEQAMGYGYTVYYFVNSIDETLGRIHELGGATVLEKKAQSENGFFANATDPEGNRFGIYELHPSMKD